MNDYKMSYNSVSTPKHATMLKQRKMKIWVNMLITVWLPCNH